MSRTFRPALLAAALLAAASLSAPASAQDAALATRAASSFATQLGGWIAAQGNSALVGIRTEVAGNLRAHLARALPKLADFSVTRILAAPAGQVFDSRNILHCE